MRLVILFGLVLIALAINTDVTADTIRAIVEEYPKLVNWGIFGLFTLDVFK